MEQLRKLQDWYSAQCDGDWEHGFGVEIATLDNPGWRLKINLDGTPLEAAHMPREDLLTTDCDWVSYWIKDRIFNAAGDPHKLEAMIDRFLVLAETNY